jgi:anti-sigma28 factor (negative regulator of flagellin synthesis)
MEEKKQDNGSVSETLYQQELAKFNKAGTNQVGSYKIETKTYEGHKFVQITQKKNSFGQPGSENYKPEKTTWVTFDPQDNDLIASLKEAIKA